jgi:hypothetical protein
MAAAAPGPPLNKRRIADTGIFAYFLHLSDPTLAHKHRQLDDFRRPPPRLNLVSVSDLSAATVSGVVRAGERLSACGSLTIAERSPPSRRRGRVFVAERVDGSGAPRNPRVEGLETQDGRGAAPLMGVPTFWACAKLRQSATVVSSSIISSPALTNTQMLTVS